MSNGLQVVMSPVQLAAVLSDETVTEAETLQNRLLGGLNVAMSTVELVGATVLCAAPDPTTLTKAACVVVGAHGLDSLYAAIDQTITGRDTRTAAYQLAVDTARQFGADETTALNIGLTVDIAVPVAFGLAIGAARIAYVRTGTFKIVEHEAIRPVKIGGHTLAKHIAIPEEDLLARLARSPHMSSVSSFYSVQQAEQVISNALKANRLKIIYWANSGAGAHPLELTYNAKSIVGYGIRQGINIKETTSTVRVVLLKQTYQGNPYYVLTSYPYMG
ncbi:MAG: RNase A-like domain-containing protein [Gibbsiella quercinecans]|uniref:RNase A-like domain-containing protein n=1 Tax=Gibbsiella quercinecans TaxID=929813 RepID=UPI003F3B09E6